MLTFNILRPSIIIKLKMLQFIGTYLVLILFVWDLNAIVTLFSLRKSTYNKSYYFDP